MAGAPTGFGDLDGLDEYCGGMLSQLAAMIAEGHTSKGFAYVREELAGRFGFEHETRNGLLTPEAIADRGRREAIGRDAALADANAPRLIMAGEGQTRGASPGCLRGDHNFGALRGPHGEAECRDCGTVIVFPK